MFNDFDLFRTALKGWDTEPIQLSAGQLRLQYDVLQFNDLSLARMRINKLLVDPCAQKAGWYNFVVCLNNFFFCGYKVKPGFMIIFCPGREYQNIVPEGWWSFEIGVSEAAMRACGLQIPSGASLAPENAIIPLGSELLFAAWRLEQEVFRPDDLLQSREIRELHAAALREHALAFLRKVLSQAGWGSEHADQAEDIRRFDLTAAALEIIAESEDLKLRDLTEQLGVSTRVLQLAFNAAGLCGPARFLLAVRLNRARRDLHLSIGFRRTVTNTALAHGFSHLARFSAQYKHLFGELPSETLARATEIRRRSRRSVSR
jgi:AraC family ethanolamine operon transcriptional activator